MLKNKRNKLICSLISVLALLSMIFPCNVAYATSVEATLVNVTEAIYQDGVAVGENGFLKSTDPISVEISFEVPVQGDEPLPASPVKKGDTATFQLSSAFKVVSNDIIVLKMGNIIVGHVTFSTDPTTHIVSANVVFDGADEVFDGTDHSVLCKFSANFEYDATGDAGNTGDHLVTILEKKYTVTVPAPETQYSIVKSGTADLQSKSIEWTVSVSATQSNVAADLSGFEFTDDLSSVGNYLTDTFTINNMQVQPSLNANKISYNFPAGSKSPEIVKFKTEIPDGKYYANGTQNISNKAQLLNSENVPVGEGSTTVSFTPKWIDKYGFSSDSVGTGTYNSKNRTITWKIVANQPGASLNNVIIRDFLPSGLTFVEANYEMWAGSDWGNATSVVPVNGEYSIGDINSKIRLTIVSSVPDEDYTTGKTIYSNSASIRWDGLNGGGISSGTAKVEVGYDAITKKGTADLTNSKIHWSVNVDTRGQDIPNLKVYDLLVYGSENSGFSLTQATGFPENVANQLTPSYNQKYISDTFNGSNLKLNVYPIYQDGKIVADLLEVSDFTALSANTMNFDSQIVNPDIFAGNKKSSIKNTAGLFSSTTKLNNAIGNVNFSSHSLEKEMLKREAVSDPVNGVNEKTTDISGGFDYIDKSVIFRLNINADGIDLSNLRNADGQVLGAATITDTLPEGWIFTEIAPGKNYMIFAGNANTDMNGTGSITVANKSPLDNVVGLNADFSTAGSAKFMFDDLKNPYVILVKARPTNEILLNYFDANKTTTVRNNLSLITKYWNPGPTDYQNVVITSKLLEKSLMTPSAGELRWMVDYKPYNLKQTGTKLEDTLPVGIDLRTDSTGTLDLSNNNIAVNEMILNTDGSYSIGELVPLEIGRNIFYDNSTRVLSFMIPDSAKSYEFNYLTDITGNPGTVSNKVSLIGNNVSQEETSVPYQISASDGTASFLRNGWISIKKVNEIDNPLGNAEFTLFDLNGQTVIRKGTTGSDGVLRLKVIPDGEYTLRETKAPIGYSLNLLSHRVNVKTVGTTVISSIDGKDGIDMNSILVKDYPEGTVGNLLIHKTVVGSGADLNKKFEFTVLFKNETLNYEYETSLGGTIQSGDKIYLSDNESLTIFGIPKNTEFKITEADYSGEGYSYSSIGDTGIIIADTTQIATYTNTYNAKKLEPSPQAPSPDSKKEFNTPDTRDANIDILTMSMVFISSIALIVLIFIIRKRYNNRPTR